MGNSTAGNYGYTNVKVCNQPSFPASGQGAVLIGVTHNNCKNSYLLKVKPIIDMSKSPTGCGDDDDTDPTPSVEINFKVRISSGLDGNTIPL